MHARSADSRRRLWLWTVLIGLALVSALASTTTPVHADTCVYTVRRGDTLSTIARRFDTTVERLALINDIPNINLIYPDQGLLIPSCTTERSLDDTIQFPPFLRQSTVDLQPIPAADELAPRVARVAQEAAVRVLVTGLGSVFQGSASVVGQNGDMLLTAYHVVARPLTRQLRGSKIQLDVSPGLSAELVDALPERDLALLRLTDASTLQPVPIGTPSALHIGESLYIVGFPAELDGELSVEGGVVIDLLRTERQLRYIVTDAYAGLGSSGGLAIDADGKLVGIVDALLTDSRILRALGYPQLERATIVIPISQAAPLLE